MITTAKDLRVRTKAILAAVARGEEVVITHRGRACAKILANQAQHRAKIARRSDAPLFGMWKRGRTAVNVERHIDQLRKGRNF